MEIRDRLLELASNLYWTWHLDVSTIFRDLNPDLWTKLSQNPIEFLDHLSDDYLEERIHRMALESRITRAYYILRQYLDSTDTWGGRHATRLRVSPVAYFSAEFGLHESLPIYSGGLGALSGDHLKSASDLDVPLVGIGLLYAKGYFTQTLDRNGWQQESYSDSNVEHLPLTRVKNKEGEPIRLALHTYHHEPILIQAWTAQVGRCQLILLDSNVDENSEGNRELTAQLYGGDQRVRIRQEFVLGVGGMRMLHAMGIRPGVLHLNEGHSAFALLESARIMMERDQQSFQNVVEIVAAMNVFTTHTPVMAGHDRFTPELIQETLGPLREQLGLNEHALMALGRTDPHNESEPFCMTTLGLKMSRHRNGVSHLHGRVSRSMWRGLWPDKSEDEVPITHITNGIHVGTWLSRDLERLFRRIMGSQWQNAIHDPRTWEAVKDIDDEELWELDQLSLSTLVDFTREMVRKQDIARGDPDPLEQDQPFLVDHALTIGFARRFAEYKRGDLLLRNLDRLDALINDSKRPIQIIFAGKAHPADHSGKEIIQRIFQITRDPRFFGKIVFLENYDFNISRQMVRGVDVWVNTPRRPLEACGTSGMKAVLNGALHCSTLDGWWAEAYDGTNGFVIGNGGEHSNHAAQDEIDLNSFFEVLEQQVVPMYYERGKADIPRRWIRMQKNALRTLPWRFSCQRMVSDYTQQCYLPAVQGGGSAFLPVVDHR